MCATSPDKANSLGALPLSRRHTPPPELRHQPGSQVNSLGAPPLSRRHTPPPELYTTSQDHRSTVLGHRRLACLANLDQARAARPALGARPADADVANSPARRWAAAAAAAQGSCSPAAAPAPAAAADAVAVAAALQALWCQPWGYWLPGAP
eukprot:354575-Chlamydomonas_euryale.AAC.5